MRPGRLVCLALAVSLAAPSAFAQDDDLLVPLTDAPKGKKKKAPPPPKKKERAAPSADEDLLDSLVKSKTELLVRPPPGVKGSRLYVDGNDLGLTTGAAFEVGAGEHTVIVKRPGYADFVRKVTVEKNKLTDVAAVLDPVSGTLAVTVNPADAAVLVDGKSMGTGSMKEVLLAPGARTVTIHKDGYSDDVTQLQVVAGKDYVVRGTLKALPKAVATRQTTAVDRPQAAELTPRARPEPVATNESEVSTSDTPLYSRWYVWAGVGAVVVACAATAYAVSNGGHHALTQQDFCGGSCDTVMNGLRF